LSEFLELKGGGTDIHGLMESGSGVVITASEKRGKVLRNRGGKLSTFLKK